MTPFLIHKSCRVFPSFCRAFSEVLFETANEVTHRFMLAEAVAKGVITADGAKALRGRFQQIPALTEYWRHTERMLALNLLFAPVNEVIIRTAQAVRQEAGLLTNDSLLVAAMRECGLSPPGEQRFGFQTRFGYRGF